MIPITYLRSSMAGTLAMCEMQFFSEYILGWTGPGNKGADRGTIVHKIMEILAKIKQAKQDNLLTINDEILGIIQILDDIYDTNIDYIIEKVYDFYSKQFDHNTWEPTDFKEVKKLTYKCLEDCRGIYHPFNQNIVCPEKRFEIELKHDWAHYNYNGVEGNLKLKGTIDLITSPGKNQLEIIDYKTGKRLNWATGEEKTYTYLQKDFQLRFYHLAASILYPTVEDIIITIYFIKDGGPFTIGFGRADIPDTLDSIREKYEYIRDMERPKLTKSWKCQKLCHQCKTTFEGCNVPVLTALGNTNFSSLGESMRKCDQLDYLFDFRDIDTIIDNMTKHTHSISHYSAPG